MVEQWKFSTNYPKIIMQTMIHPLDADLLTLAGGLRWSATSTHRSFCSGGDGSVATRGGLPNPLSR